MLAGKTTLTVTDLTQRIKASLENDFRNVSVEGEISGFKRHTSGHCYFTLKDERAQVQAVLWRSRAGSLFFTPQDGMKIIARGNITVYEVRGVYQIDVQEMLPVGEGELQLAFERLKQQLSREGYFDAAHKKPLPAFPRRIGLVTSRSGAALHDILTVISRRNPCVEVILCPVNVQGPGAAEEISRAIADLNSYGGVDVMIVGRGGGSPEDLWAFNEPVLACAIYDSNIPLVSAVGHEIDFTIADFVADLRAPTPSAAAELVVRSRAELVEIVRNFCYHAEQILSGRFRLQRERLRTLMSSYAFNRPIDAVRQFMQRTDELTRSLGRAAATGTDLVRQRLTGLEQRLASVNPDAVLKRGYALVRRDGEYIQASKALHSADRVKIRFHDGDSEALIT